MSRRFRPASNYLERMFDQIADMQRKTGNAHEATDDAIARLRGIADSHSPDTPKTHPWASEDDEQHD